MIIFNKTIEYKDWVFKSDLEFQFCLYLEQLQEAGFIKEFGYETLKLDISPSIYESYLVQLKTKIKEDKEFLMRENTYQPDFILTWSEQAKNVFYLDREVPITCKIGDIPFRLAYNINVEPISYIEVKPNFEGNLNSSKEFTIIQKWLYQDKGIFVQKVKPEKLFAKTFVPDRLIEENVYKVNTKFSTKGQSKFKFRPKTLQEYLKLRGYDNE